MLVQEAQSFELPKNYKKKWRMFTMYGSIRKSYGAKKASRENENKERKGFFTRRKSKETEVVDNVFQETSYMNVESKANKKARPAQSNVVRPNNERNNNAKSEFPIASVILTIVFTMMVMVLAFGLGGV